MNFAMSYREVEDVVDFDDDELNVARNVVRQVEATRGEENSTKDRSFAEYREENNYESDSQDGSSQDEGSNPDYDAGPQITGTESPSSNLGNLGDAFYPEDDEGGDYETDSQDTSVRYPPSDVSGSDADMLSSSEHSGSHDNADIDDELCELARPPSPMSTDAESEPDEDGRVSSPMNTDVGAEYIEMSETAGGLLASYFDSEMFEIDAHPVMSVNLSETAVQPVPSLNLKSQISLFANLSSSPLQAAYTTPASPTFVIDFGVDTSDLAPLKPDTDMSEAPLQITPLEVQNPKEHQPELEPALQRPTKEVSGTNPAPQPNQNRLIYIPVDAKVEPASVETPVAPAILAIPSNLNFDTKASRIFVSPALQSFDASKCSKPFTFAPEEPAEEHQQPTPTNEVKSSEEDECIEKQPLPETKPPPPSYKDAKTQTGQERTATHSSTTSPDQTQAFWRWATTNSSPEARLAHMVISRLDRLDARLTAWWTRNEAFSAKLDRLVEEATAEMTRVRIAREERAAAREKRRAEEAKREAEREERRAERDARAQKMREELVASSEALQARFEAHRANVEAFSARLDNYKPPNFLSPRAKELVAASLDRSEETGRFLGDSKAALDEAGARYETLRVRAEALGDKIEKLEIRYHEREEEEEVLWHARS